MDYKNYQDLIKQFQFDSIKAKYQYESIRQIIDVLMYNKKHGLFPCNRDLLPFSVTEARVNMGRCSVNGVRTYIWDLVQSTTPVFNIVWKGNSKTGYVSAVRIIDWEFVVDAIEQKYELDEFKKYNNIESNLWDLKIDIPGIMSLKGDITNDLLNKRLTDYRKGMLQRQLFWAEALLTYCPNGVLKQVCEPASTGRLYVKGLNLQNCPRRVRSIALGEHYLYDYKACAFSVFISLYYQIADLFDCSASESTKHLRDYVTNRTAIRVKIVRDLYYPTDTLTWNKKPLKDVMATKEYMQVKTAFTAMGFGAKPRAGGFMTESNGYTKTALTKIFRSKDATQDFLDHPLVSNIVGELQEVTKIVLAYYDQEDPEMEIAKDSPYTGDPLSRESKLAHIYQGHEVRLLHQLLTCAGESALLPLHDGIATKRPMNKEKLVAMKMTINKIYPFVELDKPDHKRAYFKNYEEEARIKEHKDFIRKQEHVAVTYERGDSTKTGMDIKI